MVNKYSPRLKIEVTQIFPDGTEQPMPRDIFPPDLNHHAGNKPPKIEITIEKSLGSAQDTCTITGYNLPIIEEIRQAPEAWIAEQRDINWRVRIWAWWGDSLADVETPYAPIFVGESYADFGTEANGVNDVKFFINASANELLFRRRRLNRTWPEETTYREIIEDIFTEVLADELKYSERFVISDPDGVLDENENPSPYNVNANPGNILDDIARTFDAVWGIDALVPYFCMRDAILFDDLTPEVWTQQIATCYFQTGLTSLIPMSAYTFSFDHLFDNELSVGKVAVLAEAPQLGIVTAFSGRINGINYELNNYDGHNCRVECQFLEGARAVLPPQQEFFSGGRA